MKNPLPYLTLCCYITSAYCEVKESNSLLPNQQIGNTAPLPERPLIFRNIAYAETGYTEHPHIPAYNMSIDGRIVIESKFIGKALDFHTFNPERVGKPPLLSNGMDARLQGTNVPLVVEQDKFLSIENKTYKGVAGHPALCDPTDPSAASSSNGKTNPYRCPNDSTKDCYDLVLVTPATISNDPKMIEIIQSNFTAEVTHPKTERAFISRVEIKKNKATGVIFQSPDRLLEVRIGAGRVLVARNGGDNIYAAYSKSLPACELSHWIESGGLKPLSLAYKDPIAREYGFAQYPFRYSDGTQVPDGASVGGTYPWIDSEANNITVTTIGTQNFRKGKTRYETKCPTDEPDCFDGSDSFNNYRGHAIAGLWTRGKMVQIDSLINHMDYGLKGTGGAHYSKDLHLYEGDNGWVKLNGGRYNGDVKVAGSVSNSAFFDSTESRFNFWPALRHLSFGDVVWTMSNGRFTDEFVFDVYQNKNTIIASDMVGLRDREGYKDGWSNQTNSFSEPVLIQNGATSLDWNIPTSGLFNGRIEPVAMGGIKGKGLWLGEGHTIEYEMPEQNRSVTDSYFGIFVDLRSDKKELPLFALNNNKVLIGRAALSINGREVKFEKPLSGWAHIGLQTKGEILEVLLNGNIIAALNHPINFVEKGTLRIGGSEQLGWIDSLVVQADSQDIESSCNLAMGTILGGDHLPFAMHSDHINAEVYGVESLGCYTDYSGDYAANTYELPEGTVALRSKIVFPESTEMATGKPRPDSTKNKFCTSCHSQSDFAGMGERALVRKQEWTVELDPRRQPSQSPQAASFGVLPKDWLHKQFRGIETTQNIDALAGFFHKATTKVAFDIKNININHLDFVDIDLSPLVALGAEDIKIEGLPEGTALVGDTIQGSPIRVGTFHPVVSYLIRGEHKTQQFLLTVGGRISIGLGDTCLAPTLDSVDKIGAKIHRRDCSTVGNEGVWILEYQPASEFAQLRNELSGLVISDPQISSQSIPLGLSSTESTRSQFVIEHRPWNNTYRFVIRGRVGKCISGSQEMKGTLCLYSRKNNNSDYTMMPIVD